MRFHRWDWPGILIAALGPALLLMLLFTAFDIWEHHGSPLLGILSAHIAIAVGLMAAFSRFIYRWSMILWVFAVLVAAVVGVLVLQQTGYDNVFADLLKWVALLAFILLNLLAIWQVLSNGVNPILERRDARRAAEQEQQ